MQPLCIQAMAQWPMPARWAGFQGLSIVPGFPSELRNGYERNTPIPNALIVSCCMLDLAMFCSGPVYAERIKDIASIQGVRSNQLVGYGLVVGLNKSGDKNQIYRANLAQYARAFRADIAAWH